MKAPAQPLAESASDKITQRIQDLGDWRGDLLARIRQLIHETVPEIVEEWKWMGTPVFSHNGIICTGETYQSVVKLTFAKGAALPDPSGLFNSSLEGNVRRAIDIRQNDKLNERALKSLIRAAAALNLETKAPPRQHDATPPEFSTENTTSIKSRNNKELPQPRVNVKAIQRNNVKVVGKGEQTLVFAHGYGCDQNMWRHVVPYFAADYKIVLFDYVGSGLSDVSAFDRTRYSTLRGYALDIVEILSELDLKKVHFVGHSVSSMIGALAFLEEPDRIETLTMIGPSPCYINSDGYHGGFERSDIEGLLETLESNHVAWSATMAPLIMGNLETPELAAELEASFCRMDPFIASHFARVTFLSDNRDDLPHVRAKTLILQCQKDVIAGLSVGEYVHQSLPNSELVIMDATGHCPHMSAPREVIGELQRFLAPMPAACV